MFSSAEMLEVAEPVEPVMEPEPKQQAKPKPRRRTNTQEPQKKMGTGSRLEKVDHIPMQDPPSSNKKGTGYHFERIEKQ